MLRFVWFAFLMLLPLRALADAKPTLDEKAAFFTRTLARFAEQQHIGFVVEGQPHPVVLAQITELPELPADTARGIELLADRYDYVSETRGAVVTFTKRYRFPQEMPNVTTQECYLLGKELEQSLTGPIKLETGFGQDYEGASLSGLTDSFTPEQQDRFRKGECLRLNEDFSPRQKELVRSVMLYKFLRTLLVGGAELRACLDPKIDVPFAINQTASGELVGYWIKPRGLDEPHFYRMAPRVRGVHLVDGVDVTPPNAPPLPRDSELATEAFKVISLDMLMKRLSQRSAKEGDQYSVAPALATKPVQLFGEKWAAPKRIAAAAARIYGLRVSHLNPHTFSLLRTSFPRAAALVDILALAKSALPAPLFRALHIEERLRLVEEKNRDPKTDMDVFFDAYQKVKNDRQVLLAEASAQLQDNLQPELEKLSAKTLRLSELSSDNQRRFAVYKCGGIIDFFNENTIVPYYISRFEEICISVRFIEEDGVKKRETYFNLYDAETNKAGIPLVMFQGRVKPHE